MPLKEFFWKSLLLTLFLRSLEVSLIFIFPTFLACSLISQRKSAACLYNDVFQAAKFSLDTQLVYFVASFLSSQAQLKVQQAVSRMLLLVFAMIPSSC